MTKIHHGKPSHDYGVGRDCVYPGCTSILSRYNPDDICACHVLAKRPSVNCYDVVKSKECTACFVLKPATSEFFHERNGTLVAQCKECANIKRKIYKKNRRDSSTTIVCTKCGQVKPATKDFFHARCGDLRRQCKMCVNLNRKNYKRFRLTGVG